MTDRPFTSDIHRVAHTLARGGVAVVPTDTVYGLAASLEHSDAIEQLYDLKGRPHDKPIPILVASSEEAKRLSSNLSSVACRLVRAFWPGPLTIVVQAARGVPEACLSGGRTVGLRMPDHGALLSLLAACGGALAVTSANSSGDPETVTASDAFASLNELPDIVLDCGIAPGRRPSTVIDTTTFPPTVLREGTLDADLVLAVTERS